MDELKRQRTYNELTEMVANSNRRDMINVKKLTENELVNLINTTDDLVLLDTAEREFIDRNVNADEIEPMDNDTIIREIYKTWRQS